MKIERERVTGAGWFPPWIRHEHLARYQFAGRLIEGGHVVDCACGDGTSSQLLATRATEVRGFDISADAVELARQANNARNVTYEVADAVNLPLPDGWAGAYVSLETIEHLTDEDAFLREAVRVLGDGGLFVCSTPDRDVYSPGHTIRSRPWNRFHVREYSVTEFAELLGRFFDDVVLWGQNPRSRLATGLKGSIGRFAPWDLAVRVNQAAKLPRLAYDRIEHHLVVPFDKRRRYEIVVAVCTKPVHAVGRQVSLRPPAH